jgi:hypothetical protein
MFSTRVRPQAPDATHDTLYKVTLFVFFVLGPPLLFVCIICFSMIVIGGNQRLQTELGHWTNRIG